MFGFLNTKVGNFSEKYIIWMTSFCPNPLSPGHSASLLEKTLPSSTDDVLCERSLVWVKSTVSLLMPTRGWLSSKGLVTILATERSLFHVNGYNMFSNILRGGKLLLTNHTMSSVARNWEYSNYTRGKYGRGLQDRSIWCHFTSKPRFKMTMGH